MEWAHLKDWNGDEWWFSRDGEYEARVLLQDGFDGTEWDAFQWDVYDGEVGGTIEGPWGEPTLEQAMVACECAIEEWRAA